MHRMRKTGGFLRHLAILWPLVIALLVAPSTFSPTTTHADQLAPVSAHDPSRMIYDPVGNRWLIFYTGNGIPYAVSTNQTTWTHTNTNRVFPQSGAGSDNNSYWAADMWPTPIHGQYDLFYSFSGFGNQVSQINVVQTTALSPANWVKLGTAVASVNICSGLNPGCNAPNDDYNAIDPTPFYDPVQDRLWITFGSFWDGIYLQELDPANPTIDIGPLVHLAGGRPGLAYSPTTYPDAIEGSYLWFHNGYYYLTASVDNCCSGANSTYKLIIGRSTQITGPYLDKDGVDLVNYGGSIFAASAGLEIGVGQMGLYDLPGDVANGVDRYTYHMESFNGAGSTQLGTREIDYDPVTGWPLAVYPITVPKGIYTIQRNGTSQYLHVRNESTDPTVEGHIEGDVKGTRLSQNWLLIPHSSPHGDTYYNIQNVGTGLWLEVCCNAGPGDNRGVPQIGTGTDFIREDYAQNLSTNDDQKWRIVASSITGTYNLQSYRSGLMLGFPTSAATPLAPALQEAYVRTTGGSGIDMRAFESFDLTATTTLTPSLTLPNDIVLAATSPAGAVATFTASATEQIGGLTYTVPVSYSNEPGGTFPLGTTPVTVTAIDLLGTTVTGSFNVTVTQAAPVIHWAAPEDITYGTPLGSTQLNAAVTDPTTNSNVSGTLAYAPPAGTVLPAGGGQPLSATFTPDDGTTYTTATGSTAINVNPAPLTVTADNQTMTYGGTLPTFSADFSGLAGADTPASEQAKTACSATPAAPVNVGNYPITCTLSDPDYGPITYVEGSLTISPAPLTITASSPSVIYTGTVPAITAGYSGFVPGDNAASLTAAPTCGSTAPSNGAAGSYSTSCSGAVDPSYIITYAQGTLTIGQASATLALGPLSQTYDGTAKSVSVTTTPPGLSGVSETYNGATTAPTAAGSYTVAATLINSNYTASSVGGTLTIAKATQTISFSALTNRQLGSAPFTVSATGGASGNPVTFSAGPGTVCTASGTNGTTITLVGAGTCTVTANQVSSVNYLAAAPVPQSFSVTYPPLYLVTSFTNSPAGAVKTGSIVTEMLTMGNHTATVQTVTANVKLTYTGKSGSLSLTLPLIVKLNAGQTLSQAVTFPITALFPRGSYTLSVAASDKSGDTAASSATFTVN